VELVNAPVKIVEPFAVNAAPSGGFGGIRTVPVPSQISSTPGAASFNDGFPPLTMTPITPNGGVVMSGLDMNGVLFQTSAPTWWLNSGGGFPFDATFAAAVGGYPIGARVLNAAGTGYWLSVVDNNTANPDVTASAVPDWIPLFNVTASVFASAQQTVATGTNKVLFDTVEFDTYGLYNIANTRFQISWAGKYRLSGCVFLPSAGGQNLATFIFHNGSSAKICFNYPQTSDESLALPFNAVINCAVGDFLEVFLNPSQSSVLVGNVGSNQTAVYAQLEYLGA
jgi:hypothetical protein